MTIDKISMNLPIEALKEDIYRNSFNRKEKQKNKQLEDKNQLFHGTNNIEVLNNPFESNILIAKSNIATNMTQALAEPNLINLEQYCSRYINKLEILWWLKGLNIEDDFMELFNKIVFSVDGTEITILEQFIHAYNKGEVYVLLIAILETLKREKSKPKFQILLTGIIEEFQNQESAYLFSFFCTAKDKSFNANLSNLSNLVEVITNNSFKDVKQVIKFIGDKFEGKFANIVSLYMQIAAKQFKYLSKACNKEEKTQLQDLINIESHLIVANTLYLNIEKLRKLMEIRQLHLDPNNISVMTNLIVFFENSFITQTNFNLLANDWQLYNLTASNYCLLINQLLSYLHELPDSLFNNEVMSKSNFAKELHSIMGHFMQEERKNNSQPKLSIIKSKPINYLIPC